MKTKIFFIISLMFFISIFAFASENNDGGEFTHENADRVTVDTSKKPGMRNVIVDYTVTGTFTDYHGYYTSGFWMVNAVNNGNTAVSVDVDFDDNTYHVWEILEPGEIKSFSGNKTGHMQITTWANGNNMNVYIVVSH